MQLENKILIGGRALIALGSSRNTLDTDYLVNIPGEGAFIHDEKNNVDYCNAAGLKFFAEIWKKEEGREIASPAGLLELKAFSFVQHCLNGNFQKADDAEYDMKFLIRRFNLSTPKIVKKYTTAGEFSEIMNVYNSTKK